uniref:hypothetical protein n=1 Tax=Agathobacter sp. TaxID=2021311 RepID=UPI0040560934
MKRNFDKSSSYKQCEFCQKPLPKSYTPNICPGCIENNLFSDVKEFIRSNDVNEYQVAEHFHIPLRQVKNWIKEGRIEYRENGEPFVSFGRVHCQQCGAPVSFGTLCKKCLKNLNKNMHGYDSKKEQEDSKMRFFDTENE